ncbi:MAG: O-methyltransferase [Bacilli bacterium]|nr:O-methyltransferase [Bacilli bacterium]
MSQEDTNKELQIIKKYANENNIPIMQDEGIDFLRNFIDKKGIKNILEVGTAIGYSAIMMCLVNNDVTVTTIERDETRYMEALKYIKKFNLENRITLIFNDALSVEFDEKFDLIFIDAAKRKNKEFFEHFVKYLDNGGYVVTDNMNFHGFVDKDPSEIESKNVREIAEKINEYLYFLENNMEYKTTIYQVGDGVAVTERRG